MAVGSLGSLTVVLGLDAANFVSGLARSEYLAKKSLDSIASSARTVQNTFRTIGVGLSLAGIEEFFRSVVVGAENLRNLSADTGSTVEELSRLSNIAKISGTSFDSFQAAILRLSAGLNGAEELNTKTADALKFLGVTAKDPAAALQELATKLNSFADGASKAAFARDVFGRGGAAFISTLKDIAENQTVVNTRTAKQAEEATALAQTLRTLSVQSTEISNIFLGVMVPAISEIASEFIEAKKQSDSFFGALKLFGSIDPFQSLSANLSETRARLAERQKDIDDGGKNAPFAWLGQDNVDYFLQKRGKEVDFLKQKLDVLKKTQIATLGRIDDPANYDARDIRARRKPDLGYVSPGNKTGIDDPSRALLEAALAALKANSEQEKAVLQNREQFFAASFERGELSIVDYYSKKQAAQDEDLRITSQNYLQEIALIDNFIRNAKSKQEAAQGVKQKTDATNRQQLAIIQAGGKSQQVLDEEARSLREFADQIGEVNAKMLELQGNLAAAAAIRFDAQFRSLRSGLGATGDVGTLAKVQFLNDQDQTTKHLAEAQRDYNHTLELSGIAISRVDLLQQIGSISEIDALNRKSLIGRQYIDILTREADEAQKAAEAFGAGPVREEAILAVMRMRLQIEQLGAAADGLKVKLDGIFTSNIATFFEDIIGHTKSVKQAFFDMTRGIEQAISKLVAEDLSKKLYKSLFGGQDSASGLDLGSLLAKLFGGTVAAGAASPIADFSGFFARGTSFAPGGMAVVGEKGPELVNLPRGAQVIPNEVLTARRGARGDIHVTNHINVLPGATRQSADQAADAMALALQRARGRLS